MRPHALQLSQDRLFAPIARKLGVRVPPLVISLVALGTGLASAALLTSDAPFSALVAWLLHRALTGLDGTHARTHGAQSELGAFIDRLQETIVIAAVLAVLVLAAPGEMRVLLLLLGSVLVNSAARSHLALIAERQLHGCAARGEPPAFGAPRSILTGVEMVVGVSLMIGIPSSRAFIATALSFLLLCDTTLALLWGARRLRRIDVPIDG